MQQIDLSQTNLEHVCYICGNIYPGELIRSLFTVPSNEPSMGTLFFPFVRELSRPAGAEPLRSDGSVLACRNCYEALYKQWQLQEMERIPLIQRQYTLSSNGSIVGLLLAFNGDFGRGIMSSFTEELDEAIANRP
jgi:hypothetical protein